MCTENIIAGYNLKIGITGYRITYTYITSILQYRNENNSLTAIFEKYDYMFAMPTNNFIDVDIEQMNEIFMKGYMGLL